MPQRIDAERALRKHQWPRSRRAVHPFLLGLELRFSDGQLSSTDFDKWTSLTAGLTSISLSRVAKDSSVLKGFSIPDNFRHEEFWPEIYKAGRSKAPGLSILLLLGMSATCPGKWLLMRRKDAALHDMRVCKREALSSVYQQCERLLAELMEALKGCRPEPPALAEKKRQRPLEADSTALPKRRCLDGSAGPQGHQPVTVGDDNLSPTWHLATFGNSGAS